MCSDLNRLVFGMASPSAAALRELCSAARNALESLPPRVNTSIVHIFTDGLLSWEKNLAGVGAVVLDTASDSGRVFQGVIPEHILRPWKKDAGDHLICQIELFAVVAIRLALRDLLKRRRVIFWIDNEAARFGLIKNDSSSPSMSALLRVFGRAEDRYLSYSWFSRVPSESNPADAPSTLFLWCERLKWNHFQCRSKLDGLLQWEGGGQATECLGKLIPAHQRNLSPQTMKQRQGITRLSLE